MALSALDHEEIRQTLVAYAHAVDFGQATRLAALFTNDGTFEIPALPGDAPMGGVFKGQEAIRLLGGNLWAGARGHTRHWVQPPLIESNDDDHVHCRSYVAVFRAGLTPVAGVLLTGIYEDELKRSGGRWLISSRTFHADPQPGHEVPGGDPLIAARDQFVASALARFGADV